MIFGLSERIILANEREHLIRQYEAMKNEIATYENNIGFLSVSNKKGASPVDVMRQKVEKLKLNAKVILDKIHLVKDEMEKEANEPYISNPPP